MPMIRHKDIVLVVVDMQEKLLPTIPDAGEILPQCVKLIRFAQAMDIPVLVTEQYPKGLGPTTNAITSELGDNKALDKMTFSCMGDQAFLNSLKETGRNQLLLAGIETHVCVMQTALMALESGREVFLATDAVASNAPRHYETALNRMEKAGVTLVTIEMAIFETLRVAGTPDFKKALELIK